MKRKAARSPLLFLFQFLHFGPWYGHERGKVKEPMV
jgi:hypothetical protein